MIKSITAFCIEKRKITLDLFWTVLFERATVLFNNWHTVREVNPTLWQIERVPKNANSYSAQISISCITERDAGIYVHFVATKVRYRIRLRGVKIMKDLF